MAAHTFSLRTAGVPRDHECSAAPHFPECIFPLLTRAPCLRTCESWTGFQPPRSSLSESASVCVWESTGVHTFGLREQKHKDIHKIMYNICGRSFTLPGKQMHIVNWIFLIFYNKTPELQRIIFSINVQAYTGASVLSLSVSASHASRFFCWFLFPQRDRRREKARHRATGGLHMITPIQ